MFDYLSHPLLTGLRSQLLCAAGAGEPNAAATTASSEGSQTAWLQATLAKIADVDGTGHDDSHRLELLAWLERLKSAAAAAQARVTVEFKASQIEKQRAAGVSSDQLGRGVGAQVALARQDSPYRAGRLVGLAEALVNEMPQTLAALGRGDTSEWRATLMVRETACLSSEDRSAVDAELGGRLGEFGDRRTADEARRCAYRLDPHAATRRAAAAAKDRRVGLRPAPDCMSKLTALLPVAQGVAVLAALKHAADDAKAGGDERNRGQIMADELVTRVTAKATADDVPIEVQVVMTDRRCSQAIRSRLMSPGSARSRRRWPGPGCAARTRTPLLPIRTTRQHPPATTGSVRRERRRRADGCVGSMRTRSLASWWRWTRSGAASLRGSGGSWWAGTGSVGRRGARRPSGTPTTSSRSPRAARRPL